MCEKTDSPDLSERVFNANPADHLPMVQISIVIKRCVDIRQTLA
jgi:hypothetical protein